jgi:hypothetical protein
MRVWKIIPVLLIVLVISACSSTSEESTASADATVQAPADPPAAAPRPAPAPRPSAPKTANAPATPRSEAPVRAEAPVTPADRTVAVIIPAGSEVTISLADSLNSGRNKAGDEFEANLAAPITRNGVTVIDRGTKVLGKVSAVEDSGRVKGKANMRLTLTSLVDRGRTIPIETQSYFIEAESTTGRDAAVIGGGAGIGAAIGAITGGKKGAATGAAIGGAAGGGTVLATKGKEVDFPAESKITFTLSEDLSVRR